MWPSTPAAGVRSSLQDRVAHDRDLGHDGRVAQHLVADRAALRRVAVEQRGRAPALAHQRELPGEVERVLHAGVHALAAGRAVHVRGVAGEEDAADAVVLHLALVDAEAAEPERVVRAQRRRRALVEQRLDVGERRVRATRARRRRPDVGDHAEARADDREEREDAVGLPADGDLVAGQLARRCWRSASSQSDGSVLAFEADRRSPCRTVLCAPSQPTSQSARTVSRAAVRVRKRRAHAGAVVGEGLQRHVALDPRRRAARAAPPAAARSRSAESSARSGRCCCAVSSRTSHELAPARRRCARHGARMPAAMNGSTQPWMSSSSSVRGQMHERLRLVGARRRLVDDAHVHPEPLQIRGHRHADRPRTRDQHHSAHRSSPARYGSAYIVAAAPLQAVLS